MSLVDFLLSNIGFYQIVNVNSREKSKRKIQLNSHPHAKPCLDILKGVQEGGNDIEVGNGASFAGECAEGRGVRQIFCAACV